VIDLFYVMENVADYEYCCDLFVMCLIDLVLTIVVSTVMAARELKAAQKAEAAAEEPRGKLLQVASSKGRLIGFLAFLAVIVVIDLKVIHPYVLGL
jgi:uncharacterized membrane protein